MTTFSEFGLDPLIENAVEKLGFESATPIQAATIPTMLTGTDVIGQARTGSGKTAAFGLPLLHKIDPKKVEDALQAQQDALSVERAAVKKAGLDIQDSRLRQNISDRRNQQEFQARKKM